MRKTKKQLMKFGIAGLLIASMAVGGGTLAYLTDAETTENTFTVGKVKISLSEPNYPGNDSEQVKDLVPNEIVKKDPQVKNVGINDAIIYLKVEVPKADVTLVEDGGARGDKKVQEIFALKNLKTGDDGTWMEIRKDDSATDKCVYVFAYKTKLTKDSITTPLFDEVQLKNVLEKEIDATTQDIKINAYAIQADNILDVDTTTLDQTILDKVYDIYVNQSGNKDDQNNRTTVLLSGPELNIRMKTLAGDTSPKYDSANGTIAAIQYSDTEPSEEVKADVNSLVSTAESEKPVYMWFENGTIKWWSEAKKLEAGDDLSHLCDYMVNLTDISGLTDWNTDNVTHMYCMFRRCGALKTLTPLSTWNTENVTDIWCMFQLCANIESLNALSDWNTENVTDMSYLFDCCSTITDLSPLTNWNTSNVTDMRWMFGSCTNLTDLTPISNWDVSNVQSLLGTFSTCTGLVDLSPISDWNVSNVTTMKKTFKDCTSLVDLTPIGGWDVSNVADMNSLFDGCNKLSDVSAINDWNITKVTDFVQMFRDCPSHPEFTKRAGTWSSDGTFIPTT